VRGTILGSRVGLNLDDPPNPPGALPFADKERPEEALRRLDDGSREKAGQVAGGRQGKSSRRSDGTIQPKSRRNSGMSESRKSPTTWDVA